MIGQRSGDERISGDYMKTCFTKKIIAILLTVAMVVIYFPAMAFAVGEGEQSVPESEQNVQEPEENIGDDVIENGAQGTDTENGAQDVAAEDDAQDTGAANDAKNTDNASVTKGADDQASGDAEEPVYDAVNKKAPLRASGDESGVTTWAELQTAVNNAGDGDTITLGEDITAGSSDSYINIPSDKNVTIDLNGKTLDRSREAADKNGHVIKVSGKLTITDSVGTGVIKGGYATDGGGIYVDGKKAVLTIEGGSISGNKASNNGGGIYVNMGKLYIQEGTISKNTAGRSGGGLHFWGMDEWSDNGAHARSEAAGEVEIVSAEFSENEAGQDGGAICLFGSDTTIHNVTANKNKDFNIIKKEV